MINILLAAATAEHDVYGVKWYFYFIFLGAVIIVCSIILALWNKKTNTALAYKFTKKSKIQLIKAKKTKKDKIHVMAAQNYIESAEFYISQDDRTEDIALTFARRELIKEIVVMVRELNHETIQEADEKVIDEIIKKMDRLDDIK